MNSANTTLALTPEETRVLGCLLEKQRTTPDMYPLTLNGLRLACNQSTNRDPVVDYDDAVVRNALHRLERRGFTRLASGRGSRAPKYRHLLAEALPMGEDEHALMCVLMLRGPQTPGELKQRAERIKPFDGLETVHETLRRLIGRGMVARLERRPGQKEERYAQLLEDRQGSEDEGTGVARPASASFARDGDRAPAASEQHTRDVPASPAWMASVEERLASLEREVEELRGTGGSSEANGSGTGPAVRE
jgi:uncharacterized protein YceH (UPF0502 family)